jgi:hypothetical protein
MPTPTLTPEQTKYLQRLRECLSDGDGISIYTDSAQLADILQFLPPTPPRAKTERELDYEAFDVWRNHRGPYWNVSFAEAFIAGCESVRARLNQCKCDSKR